MTYKLKDTKYTFYKREGKNCYIWFELRDYWNETVFKSSMHKISLNAYRIIPMKHYLNHKGVYI